MRKTTSLLTVLAMLAVLAMPATAVACSYPEPRPFREQLERASSIFIFRLESAELIRKEFNGGSYSEWIEGRIRVVQNLKGESLPFQSLTFSTHWCGGLRLDVGHYFLVVTTDRGPVVRLGPSDPSIIDITRWYSESRPDLSAKTELLGPIFAYLDGTPLPDRFPPDHVASLTSSLPPLPPSTPTSENP